MKFNKSNPFFSLVNTFLIDSPLPYNINYFWNFGSLLGLNLFLLILTGLTLAMHYNPSIDFAFASVEHIMRDVNNGWLIRFSHANAVNMFFFLVYIHIGRGLFYGSYRAPRRALWIFGVIIFLFMVIIAFLGYVLPWGQMSYWGTFVPKMDFQIFFLCSAMISPNIRALKRIGPHNKDI